MKVVRLLTSDFGGAALCVSRLHEEIIKLGVEEKILVADRQSDNPDVIKCEVDAPLTKCVIIKKFLTLLKLLHFWPRKERVDYLTSKGIQGKGVFCYTSPFSYYKNIAKRQEIREADIINLQWVANFVDLPSFFKKVKKPIVWSLHDENPFRGGLHYACDDPSIDHIEKRLLKIKKVAYSYADNLNVVVQSEYMKRQCLSSELLSSFPVHVIPNGVNVNQFKMYDKNVAKKRVGIREDKKVFLFVSVILEEPRKGLKELISALESLDDDNVELLCIGRYSTEPTSKIPVKCLGFVSDYDQFSIAYSAADYFVHPSFQESFAKTPLEAMACGTPVIAFPCSGTEDCITKETGVICDDFTVEALRQGILVAMKKEYPQKVLREYVAKNFSFDLMAHRYKKLYDEILKKEND